MSARVLIAEDERIVAKDLQAVLASLGYEVVDNVATGSDAVTGAESHRPDLVLMDIALKGPMDGIIAAAVIRERCDIPVVFVTAHADPHTLERAKITEPFGYVLKPFDERELHTAIEMAVHKHAMERELRTNRQWLATTLRSIGDAVIVTDPRGLVALINPVAEKLTGWVEQDAVGRPLPEVFQIINEHSRQPVESPVDLVLRDGVTVGLANHTLLISRDGQEHPIDDSAAPILENQGSVLGVVLVFRDVTERRRLEAELRERARELEAANTRKDEFLAMLAHELRNPLAPIRTGLDLLQKSGQTAPVVGIMQRQVDYLVRLVDDLLDVSRITRGKIELRKQPIDLEVVLTRAVEMTRPLMEERQQSLSISGSSEPIQVHADAVRLTQVFGNILSNAVRYSRPGGRIFMTTEREGEHVCVLIRDEGAGIDPQLLPRIFDLFTQGQPLSEEPQAGLGIGLTLVHTLVRMHDGEVIARSEGRGRGSEFTVSLPVIRDVPAFEDCSGPTATTAPAYASRVLIVDDNHDAASVVAMLLERLWQPELAIVHTGPEALRVAEEFRPEAVLLDVGLPGMSGYEVAQRLRGLPGGNEMLLVALTGYGSSEDRERTRAAGFDHHLVKPASVESLSAVLRKTPC